MLQLKSTVVVAEKRVEKRAVKPPTPVGCASQGEVVVASSATQQRQGVDLNSGPPPPALVDDISPISTSNPPVIPLLATYEEEFPSAHDSSDLGPEPDIELGVPEAGWDDGLELDYEEEVSPAAGGLACPSKYPRRMR